jgi:hypothetical protein
MISGYEHRWQVEDHITALKREFASAGRDPRHAPAIERELAIFQKELRRLKKEGYYGPEDANRGRGGRSMLIRNATTGADYQEWVA